MDTHVKSRGTPRPALSSRAPSRVLHVNSGNLYGGVETILVTLARLREQCPGMEPHFALCREGRLSEELTQAGVPVYLLGNVRISRPWTVWRARRRLREILGRTHFDMVICHMPWSLSVFGGAVKNAGQRLGFWAHAYHGGGGWLERLARRTSPDLAIANSFFTERGLANLFPATPHFVVHPPVTLAPLEDAAQTRALLRRQLEVSDETAVIIQVSRIEACKGHLVHLQALAQLKGISTPWVCWMAGGAQRAEELEYLRELQETAASLGLKDRVRFLGQRSDVRELLAAADIFCQPNQTPDSFGITFIEALGAGRPVITSSLGGALEIIDESSGFLVPPGDSAVLAERLRALIEQPQLRERFVRTGALRAQELCNAGQQINLLAQVVSREARPGQA